MWYYYNDLGKTQRYGFFILIHLILLLAQINLSVLTIQLNYSHVPSLVVILSLVHVISIFYATLILIHVNP